jgi:cysteine desulfurase
VLESLRELGEEGFEVEPLETDDRGRLDPEAVAARVRPDTVLVAVMHGNNEVGTVNPVERIAALVKERNPRAAVHVDAVQTFGRLPIDLDSTPAIDAVAASGHKLHAPKGVGFLAVGKKARPVPILRGGGQEGGLRSGTENVPGIVALARAAELMREEGAGDPKRALRDRLLRGILDAIPDVRVNGDPENGLSHVLSVAFRGVAGEALLHHLEAEGIDVATGSACAEKKKAPSPVLVALKLTESEARGTIRFSFGRFNTEADVDRTLAVLPRLVSELRALA